jgi:tetratricopeptide (TPR) repeat protein
VLAYWIGECHYALGRPDEAATQFTQVVNSRPWSEKHEAADYRLALIRQTKTQIEILDMLTWSYTEYLKTVEEYQRLLAEAETRIHTLEDSLNEVAQAAGAERTIPTLPALSLDPDPEHSVERIRELKAQAEKLRAELMSMTE